MIKSLNVFKSMLLLASLSLFIACNDTKTNQDTVQTTEETHDQAAEDATAEEHAHNNPGQVQLDNGKKWKANIETTQGIANMQKIVNDGINNNTDPQKLSEPLQLEFKTIFDKCTMTGEAHNQLHAFLIPVKDKLDIIKEGGSAETLVALNNYLSTYNQYFE